MEKKIYQKIKNYSHKCITVLVLSNNIEIINNCLKGMNLQNIYGKKSYCNLDKLNIKKTIFLEKDSINNINFNNNSFIKIEEYYLDILKNFRYDMLIIDIKFNEIEINKYLNIFMDKINCFILVNKNIKLNNDNQTWNTKYNESYIEMIYDVKTLYKDVNFYTYREKYRLFNEIITTLNKNNIIYRLAGYDCLTSYIFNSHSVFVDNMEICIHNNYKQKLIDIFANIITTINTGTIIINYLFLILKISLYETSGLNVKPRKFIFIEDPNISFEIDEAGDNAIKQTFGSIEANTFKNPEPYLIKKFGVNFLNTIKFPLLNNISYDPRIIYSDYYDYYSHNRSDRWRLELINAGNEVMQLFINNNIKCWLDGGSLLGAVRNGDIPPGDDDVDIGVFTSDLNKIYKLTLPKDIYIEGFGCNNGCVFRKKINNILYDVEILAYFKNNYGKYQCNRFGDTQTMKNRAEKCAINCKYYDTLESIILGDYTFFCPLNPYEYIELPEKYGVGCIDSDPKPHDKSGGQKWINFENKSPSIRY